MSQWKILKIGEYFLAKLRTVNRELWNNSRHTAVNGVPRAFTCDTYLGIDWTRIWRTKMHNAYCTGVTGWKIKYDRPTKQYRDVKITIIGYHRGWKSARVCFMYTRPIKTLAYTSTWCVTKPWYLADWHLKAIPTTRRILPRANFRFSGGNLTYTLYKNRGLSAHLSEVRCGVRWPVWRNGS